jgi:hypothetical protein
MLRRTVLVPALASLTLVSGCAVDVLLAPAYGGVYDLQWVNGFSVPATVVESGSSFRVEVTYGTLHLRGDGTFSLDYGLQQWDNGVVTRSSYGYSGSYDITDRDLFLNFVDPSTGQDRSLSGFVRDGYAEVQVDGVVDRQSLQFGFQR